jgi:formamidopyrimidine-DNA glycosylase
VPELPDVTIYVESLERRLGGQILGGVRTRSPFLLRSVDPPLSAAAGREVVGFERLGKRILFALTGGLFLVLHLMVAGRLRLKKAGAAIPGKVGVAAFDFPMATLLLTEASSKKRASLHLVAGRDNLTAFDRGGIEVDEATLQDFAVALTTENHTLKRSLTDPRILSGIGNAYSDEILHRARLSPVKLSQRLGDDEIERLYHACRTVLADWTDRLRREVGQGFPDKVTAFRPEMAVHGKHRQPCPVCGTQVQRIRYVENETNYCPTCQTGGRLLADRSLSRLLKKDWPKTVEELEELKRS